MAQPGGDAAWLCPMERVDGEGLLGRATDLAWQVRARRRQSAVRVAAITMHVVAPVLSAQPSRVPAGGHFSIRHVPSELVLTGAVVMNLAVMATARPSKFTWSPNAARTACSVLRS